MLILIASLFAALLPLLLHVVELLGLIGIESTFDLADSPVLPFTLAMYSGLVGAVIILFPVVSVVA